MDTPEVLDGRYDGERAAAHNRLYWYALATAIALLALATVTYRQLEGWGWVDAFYFSAVAVTTVGFGDFAPTSDAGKLFTVAYIFAGIALITTVLAETLRRYATHLHARHQQRKTTAPADGADEPTVVVALFPEQSKAEQALLPPGRKAAAVEVTADEAIVVTADADGTFSVHSSDHSAPRSLATLAAKLMVVLPLGFHGALATMTAAAEVSAATRSRPERDIQPTDLAFLTSRMQPGWAAVVAVYPEQRVPRAVAMYDKLGAVMVWYASEERIADAA
jgi:voltage-gated potassium channel